MEHLLYTTPAFTACLAGLAFGFGKHWENACLFACVGVPAVVSLIFAITTGAWAWGLIYFVGLAIATFLIWGTFAGVRYGISRLHLKE